MNNRASVILVTASLVAAGCGSAQKVATAPTASQTAPAKAPAPSPPPARVTEGVRTATPGKPFTSATTAAPGDTLQFVTRLPGAATSHPADVRLKLANGPGAKLTVTARAHGHSSTATATVPRAGRTALKLAAVRYICNLPPEASFCPARRQRTTRSGYEIAFSATPASPIVLSVVLGPDGVPAPKAGKPGTLIVPPYEVAEGLRVIPAAGASAKAPAPSPAQSASVSVRPGDMLAMISHLTGTSRGAAQRLTVRFSQGPARSIEVSAAVAGGRTAHATIKGASGSSIGLVLPRYACYLSPTPTFCPARKVHAGTRRYSLTFSASPRTAPVVVLVTVQVG